MEFAYCYSICRGMDNIGFFDNFPILNIKSIDMEKDPDTMSEMQPPSKPPAVATGYESDDIQDIAEKIASLTGMEAKELEMYLAGKITNKNSKKS